MTICRVMSPPLAVASEPCRTRPPRCRERASSCLAGTCRGFPTLAPFWIRDVSRPRERLRVSPIPMAPNVVPPVRNHHGTPSRAKAEIPAAVATATDVAGADIGIVGLREAPRRRGEREHRTEHGHSDQSARTDRTFDAKGAQDRYLRPFAHVSPPPMITVLHMKVPARYPREDNEIDSAAPMQIRNRSKPMDDLGPFACRPAAGATTPTAALDVRCTPEAAEKRTSSEVRVVPRSRHRETIVTSRP